MSEPPSPSSPPLDRARVEHVAKLASLRLTSDEAERLAVDLANIVRYVEELASLDTTDVPPTAHIADMAPALRPDEVLPGLERADALAQAPRAAHDGFAVPAFVEA